STRCLTHLVVQPSHEHRLARLVPVSKGHVDAVATGGVVLECTIAELKELKPLQDAEYVRVGERPAQEPDSDIGIEQMADFPPSSYFGDDGLSAAPPQVDFDPHVMLTYDRVPKGM